ncbi:hypothetical protein [Priestia megaterium]|uniref:hypothetical protein n=1 Tax=Priestia megaterium TaxID=1404 RepID=UPI001F3B3114|nr:hypothetical protein [Priestia megaterium]
MRSSPTEISGSTIPTRFQSEIWHSHMEKGRLHTVMAHVAAYSDAYDGVNYCRVIKYQLTNKT